MSHFLVLYHDDYADDFDVEGFAFFTADELTKFLKSLDEFRYPVEYYFGTNENLVYDSKSEILAQLTTKEITEDEFNVLTKLFPTGSFGGWPSFESQFDYDYDDDEVDNQFPG